ncbi:MAG: cation-translocating P-type ATPase [Actinomycetes bacterium]
MDETGETALVGLSSEEARRRLDDHGPNELPQPPRDTVVTRAWAQLRDPMIMLLLAAGVVTAVVGDVTDTAVIAVVVVLNTTIGVVQEVRAGRAIAELNRLAAPRARVTRDGVLATLAAGELVPGDVVHLDAGDIVPADGTVLEAHRLQLDESATTGESVPVEHEVGSEVLSGTVVTRGRAVVTVTRTGADSGLGRIAALIAAAPTRATPLQQRLIALSRVLVVAVLALAVVVLVLGLVRGRDVVDMLVVAVSLSVAAVPESLPAVVSVALALGAHRMARRSAMVRRLPAVETLGSVTVIASDKTGTLTEGRMVAEGLWTPTATYQARGAGYSPAGEVELAQGDEEADRVPLTLLRDVVLCNDAHLLPPTGHTDWTPAGDPLEAAMLAVAARGGVDPDAIREQWPRQAEIPFDSLRQRMTTLHAAGDGWLVVSKGAPEVVLRDLVDGDRTVEAARDATERLAGEGYRVIAVAEAHHDVRPAELERGLRLVGLVAVADPPRDTAREVVEACRDAGIRFILVTGDHRDTARAIAARVGIADGRTEAVDGEDVARGDHVDRVASIGVYARTRPEQKVDIIEALQRAGEVVAMTGDGVNDAPALRRADIGVAMGRGGTEVARQAAALVLADDDLRTVVAAVEEGRRIFANIRAFLRYAVAGGFAEILVMLVGPFLGVAVPLLPAQILWINMLTHGLPGVAFGAEPLDPSVMRRPSAPPQESVLGGGLWRQIATTGALIAAVAVGAGLWADASGEHAQSWIFLTLGLGQLGVALALRARVRPRPLRQRGLEAAVAGAAALQVAGVYFEPLQALLGTQSIGVWQGLCLAVLSAIPGLMVALSARWVRTGRPVDESTVPSETGGVSRDTR